MLGGVPMSVVNPPRSELKASGMSSFDAGIRVRREMSMTTGNRSAATPTLFMNAERIPAVSMITSVSRVSLVPPRRRT